MSGWLAKSAIDRARKTGEFPRGPDAGAEVLIEEAGRYISAGVSITRADWEELSGPEQDAFVAARKRIDVQNAIWLARAARGGELNVRAEIDGGEEHDRAVLRQWMSQVGYLRDRGLLDHWERQHAKR